MEMRFARHETFHLREGWLTKGLRKVIAEGLPNIFLRKDAIEHLGIGSNMVRSLRFWMQATGVYEEVKENGKVVQRATRFGELVYRYDSYLEDEMTLWLLHYHLVRDSRYATTWYWFFNHCEYREFDESIFLAMLENWVQEQGGQVARGSLKRDFDCFLNTYLVSKYQGESNPEDNLGCPLRELGILEFSDERNRRYRVTRRPVVEMPEELFYFCLLDHMKAMERRHVTIDELLYSPGSLGRVFALGLPELLQVLEMLQHRDYLYLTRTAGLNNVTLLEIREPQEILEEYYRREMRCED